MAEPLSAEEQMTLERIRILSEIIESERAYVSDLKDLTQHYIIPLLRPGMWGGAGG